MIFRVMKILGLIQPWCMVFFAGTPGYATELVSSYFNHFSLLSRQFLLYLRHFIPRISLISNFSLSLSLRTMVALRSCYQAARKNTLVLVNPWHSFPIQMACTATKSIRVFLFSRTMTNLPLRCMSKIMFGRKIISESLWTRTIA